MKTKATVDVKVHAPRPQLWERPRVQLELRCSCGLVRVFSGTYSPTLPFDCPCGSPCGVVIHQLCQNAIELTKQAVRREAVLN